MHSPKALFTLVRFLMCVSSDVTNEIAGLFEFFSAILTLMPANATNLRTKITKKVIKYLETARSNHLSKSNPPPTPS